MGHVVLNGVYDWQQGPRGGEKGFVVRHGHGHGAARARRRHAPAAGDAEPRSADGPARLSAPPRRRRDRGRRRRRSIDRQHPHDFFMELSAQLQPRSRRPRSQPVRLCRPARRARLRPARLHAPHVDHGFARGADQPSLARFDPYQLRRRHRRPRSSATSRSKARASTAASPTSAAGTSRPGRSIRPLCACPGTRPTTCRCRRAGRIWSSPEQLEPGENSHPLVGERDLHAAIRRRCRWWSATLAWGRRDGARRLRPRKRRRPRPVDHLRPRRDRRE